MISKIAAITSSYIARELNEPSKEPIINYGFQVIFGALFKGLVIFLLAYLLGIVIPTFIVISSAVFFRIISGGPHCTSYARCLMASILVFLSLGYVSDILMHANYNILDAGNLNILFIALAAIAIIWIPGEHSERVLSRNKKLLSKCLSLIVITVLWIVYKNYYQVEFLIPVLLGFAWQGFSITPPGYKFMAILDASFKFIQKEVRI